jgi:hypothetical protein
VLSPGNLFPADNGDSFYGHISYVNGEASVIRQDQTKHKAVVNLPVVPGDQVITGKKGRCELQFDNGTIVRLDKDSRLKVTTVLAPALTSKWKITTLHLMRGSLYAMNQSYGREMFQVITPNAAVDLKKKSTATIQLDDKGNTHLFSDRGKFKVMYGGDVKSVKTETVRSGKGYTITADHQIKVNTEGELRDIDFLGWNEYVNRNFKDLHFGISKIPKKIYRYNKAIVYWAEKWSSLVGEWVYDDLFGYIWKPADEIFALSSRPFFHANYVKINGEMYVVPQQPWGWAPAHLGTWVWMKWGWTWVPGNAFYSGIRYDLWNLRGFTGPYAYPSFFFPTLGYWVRNIYGSYGLYYTYRCDGEAAWRRAYRKAYNTNVKRPLLNKAPLSVRKLIKKMNKAPVKTIKERLGTHRPSTVINGEKIKPFLKSTIKTKTISKSGLTSSVKKVKTDRLKAKAKRAKINPMMGLRQAQRVHSKRAKPKDGSIKNFRDWNPDKKWAIQRGYTLRYSSKTNAVVLPEWNLNSRKLTSSQRAALRGNRVRFSSGRGRYGSDVSTGSSSGSSTGSSNTSSVVSRMGSAASKSGGGVGNSANTKDN